MPHESIGIYTGFFNGSKTPRWRRDRMNWKLSWSSWDSSTSPLMSRSHVPWVFITKIRTLKTAGSEDEHEMWFNSWNLSIIRKIMKIQKKSVTSSLGSATKYLATFSRRSEVSTRYVTCLLGSCTDTHTVCLEVTRLGWNWGVVVAAADVIHCCAIGNQRCFLTLKSCLISFLVFSHAVYEFEIMNLILVCIFWYITGWNVIQYWYLIKNI